MTLPPRWLALSPHASLKRLELPSLYNRKTDELFELDDEGFEALSRCDGGITAEEAALDPEFLEFCLAEGLLESSDTPLHREIRLSGPSPLPSLRYLEVQVTRRCNLSCAHCYLGDAKPIDLSLDAFAATAAKFERLGGLRLMISGGEPTLHPRWNELNELMAGVGVRRVLLTNGLPLLKLDLRTLNFDDVQVSIDGMRHGHETLRGRATFDLAVRAARNIAEAGIDLSISTQLHSQNLGEIDELEKLVRSLGAREWGIDAPCVSGRLIKESPLSVTAVAAAQAMSHAYGGSYHGGGGGMACGLHLATVGADGAVAQCGFYFDEPLGDISEGLGVCWSRREALPLAEVAECAGCEVAEDCGGGCRFRAGGKELRDRVMCAVFGI